MPTSDQHCEVGRGGLMIVALGVNLLKFQRSEVTCQNHMLLVEELQLDSVSSVCKCSVLRIIMYNQIYDSSKGFQ